MIRFHMLITSEQEDSKPPEIKQIVTYTTLSICNNQGQILATGDHVLIEGSEKDIKNWLSKYPYVWLGEGHPMEQRFTKITKEKLYEPIQRQD